jgi:hypothetical protein
MFKASTGSTITRSWKIEVIDNVGDVGWYASLALDSDDRPHISYSDYTNADWDLKYASRIDGEWRTEIIDDEGEVGLYTSIALDSGDRPHISYLSRDPRGLKYANWVENGWKVNIVNSDRGAPSIALDSNDRPHISYGKSAFILDGFWEIDLKIHLLDGKWMESGDDR